MAAGKNGSGIGSKALAGNSSFSRRKVSVRFLTVQGTPPMLIVPTTGPRVAVPVDHRGLLLRHQHDAGFVEHEEFAASLLRTAAFHLPQRDKPGPPPCGFHAAM